MTIETRSEDILVPQELIDAACKETLTFLLGAPGSTDGWFQYLTSNGADQLFADELKQIAERALSGDAVRAETELKDAITGKLERMAEVKKGPSVVAEGVAERLKQHNEISNLMSQLGHDARTYVLGRLPSIARTGVALAGFAATWMVAGPPLMSVVNQVRFDILAGAEIGARNGGTLTLDGRDLAGANIRFACMPVEHGAVSFWEPVEVVDKWESESLKTPFFGVQVLPEHGSVGASVVHAGWGTTVEFTPEQIDQGIDHLMGAVEHVTADGVMYTLPHGAFREDMMAIIEADLFSTGERSEDGYLTQYYPINADGELACDGVVQDGESLRMVEGTLVLEMPEHGLDYYLEDDEELAYGKDYEAAFEQFDLGDWYRVYYSGVPDALDVALRNGSTRGVPRKVQEAMVSYFQERTFEQTLLRELRFLEGELTDEAFQQVVRNIADNLTHSVDLTNTREMLAIGAIGLHHPGARGSKIDIRSDLTTQEVENTAQHEYNHALIQMDPVEDTDLGDLFNRLEEFRVGESTTAINSLTEGMTEWLSLVGGGEISKKEDDLSGESYSYKGRVDLIHALYQAGYLNDLMKIYTGNPDTQLSQGRVEVITVEWGLPMLENNQAQHFVSILFDELKLTNKNSSEMSLTLGKQVYLYILEMNNTDDQEDEGRDQVTRLAGYIAQIVTDLDPDDLQLVESSGSEDTDGDLGTIEVDGVEVPVEDIIPDGR